MVVYRWFAATGVTAAISLECRGCSPLCRAREHPGAAPRRQLPPTLHSFLHPLCSPPPQPHRRFPQGTGAPPWTAASSCCDGWTASRSTGTTPSGSRAKATPDTVSRVPGRLRHRSRPPLPTAFCRAAGWLAPSLQAGLCTWAFHPWSCLRQSQLPASSGFPAGSPPADVPNLAAEILEGNRNGRDDEKINLQGFLVGETCREGQHLCAAAGEARAPQ